MKIIEKPDLPKEIFAIKAAPQLLSQAVRVHLANQRQGTQSALTRAEVSRTRKKLYKQKGTGGARHGDKKAPIFVGGGIAFAPKPRDYSQSFTKKMRQNSIYAALSSKLQDGSLLIVSDMDKIAGKTKEVAKFLATMEGNSRNLLIITDEYRENIFRASRNIPGVIILPANQVNTYEILKADKVLVMEQASDKFGRISHAKNESRKVQEKKIGTGKTKTKLTLKAKTPSKATRKVIKKVAIKAVKAKKQL